MNPRHVLALSLALGGCAYEGADRKTGSAVFLVEGEEHRLAYERIGEDMVFEGDIVLDAEDLVPEETGVAGARAPLYSVAAEDKLWPGAVVPYVIADSVTTPARVRNAMAVWEATGIRFVERTRQTSYVVFRERDQRVCSASVGYRAGSVRYVNLRLTSRHDPCPTWVIVHEIGHSLGLWHEQTRPDRNDHVRINWANIADGYADQFEIGPGRRLGPYDVESTMHYHSNMLSNGDGPTIVRRDGTRIHHDWMTLSRGDIDGIRELYGLGDDRAATEPPAMEPDDGGPSTGEEPGEVVDAEPEVSLTPAPSTLAVDLGPEIAVPPTPRTDDRVAGDEPVPPMAGSCSAAHGRAPSGLLVLVAAVALGMLRRRRTHAYR